MRLPRAPSPSTVLLAAYAFITVCRAQDIVPQIVAEAATDPVKAAEDALTLPGIKGNRFGTDSRPIGQWITGDSNTAQLPWNVNIPFIETPTAQGDPTNGWQGLPALQGFTLNRETPIQEGAVQPFYITANYDPLKIKRAIVVMPGLPRDSWKYVNLVRNALTVVSSRPENGITQDQVLIIGPAWMNNNDSLAGAVQPGEIFYHGSQWEAGGNRRLETPHKYKLSSFTVMDYLLDMVFNKTTFPALNKAVVVGHSMGGQAVQKFALLKMDKVYDPNLHYWIGNPGSWTWLNTERPVNVPDCPGFDQWHYGLGNASSLYRYGRGEVEKDRNAVVKRFLGRHVHYFLGLLDDGPGDTHCEALTQGANHLERGSEMIKSLGKMSGGFPKTHTLGMISNTSHQDYAMLSSNESLYHLFLNGFNESLPYTYFPSKNDPQKGIKERYAKYKAAKGIASSGTRLSDSITTISLSLLSVQVGILYHAGVL